MSPSTVMTASSPASVVTPDTTKVAADKDTLLAAATPTSPNLKDQRAFEHDRQRVKKAADLVKMRARKAQGRWSSLAKGEMYFSAKKIVVPPTPEKEKRLRAEEVDPLDGPLPLDTGYDVVPASGAPAQPVEVKLADLITFRKARKSPEGDFVFIPPQRSVIVLDDITPHEFTVDEPWEHIYCSDDEAAATTPTKGPTYADILSMKTK